MIILIHRVLSATVLDVIKGPEKHNCTVLNKIMKIVTAWYLN